MRLEIRSVGVGDWVMIPSVGVIRACRGKSLAHRTHGKVVNLISVVLRGAIWGCLKCGQHHLPPERTRIDTCTYRVG